MGCGFEALFIWPSTGGHLLAFTCQREGNGGGVVNQIGSANMALPQERPSSSEETTTSGQFHCRHGAHRINRWAFHRQHRFSGSGPLFFARRAFFFTFFYRKQLVPGCSGISHTHSFNRKTSNSTENSRRRNRTEK
uniref:(northern house mosquito) hypothetical protein n=1 Tax=Culex pipiens TaxID=7175 RepID=A0A8D8L6Y8_CULPI